VNEVFCDRDEVRAAELGQQFIGDYYESAIKHYELTGSHFAGVKGYEYYQKSASSMQRHSSEDVRHWYADVQCYGTPDQCVDRVAYISEAIGCAEFVGWFSYAGMPDDEAKRNLRLFAVEVMPRLKEFGLRSKQVPGGKAAFPVAF
jgi:alkanesulfonate monooxygenase SsuD/methylene tetrahydromethanopterin reductase-like flavin-dependent oxidoreductase (luciferase family)